MSIKNLVFGTSLALVGWGIGMLTEHMAATIRAEALAERVALQQSIDARRDVAALGVRSCGKLEMVIIFKADGTSDATIVATITEARLNGVIARVKLLDRAHVYAANIGANCQSGTIT
jgi:hypothetical protein